MLRIYRYVHNVLGICHIGSRVPPVFHAIHLHHPNPPSHIPKYIITPIIIDTQMYNIILSRTTSHPTAVSFAHNFILILYCRFVFFLIYFVPKRPNRIYNIKYYIIETL